MKFIQRLKIFKTQGTRHRTVPCVTINGKIGDVAVVVKVTGKNRYSTHRILMPDGSEFVFEENKNTEPTFSDMLAQKSDQGTDISSVSDITVSQKPQSVNTSISENAENDKNIAPVKNSLSEQGKQPSFVGTPLKDLYYGDDIAPVKDAAQTETQYDEVAPITESNTPLTEEEANARKSYIIEYKAGEFVLESAEVKLHFEYINNTLNKYRICQILIQGVVFVRI